METAQKQHLLAGLQKKNIDFNNIFGVDPDKWIDPEMFLHIF